MPKTHISFRFDSEEVALLKNFAERKGRTQSDVVRELVRSLARKK